jgi:signal peptidase II
LSRITASRGLALLIVLLVTADWASKLWITNRLALGETRALIDGWLYFVHRQNPGIAFSLFADLPAPWRVPLLAGLSAVGIVLLAGLARRTPDRLARIAGAVVIAGALGNLGDRVLTGQVTDFVFLAFFPFVFNLADAAITLGGSLLAVRLAMAGEEPAAVAAGGGGGRGLG